MCRFGVFLALPELKVSKHGLNQKHSLTSPAVDYETPLNNLPPVSSEAFVVLTQPTTPLGADLRHINIHHNTGDKILTEKRFMEAEIIWLVQVILNR